MKKILFIALGAIIIFSCSDDLQEELMPTKNMMSFNLISDLQSLTANISLMTDDELDQWERNNNFTSFRSAFEQANQEWALLDQEGDQTEFLKVNQDILTLEDSVLVPRIGISIYQAITNREGEYETMGFINKVIGDYVVSVKKSDQHKLRSINANQLIHEAKALEANGIKVFKVTGSETDYDSRTKVACSTNMVASYYDNRSGCRNDNEVFITARSYVLVSTSSEGDWRQPWASVEVSATERDWLCKWYSYKTQLEYRSVSFSLMAWTSQNGTGVPTLFSRTLPYKTTTVDAVKLRWESPIGDPLLNQLISAQPFTYFYGQASSRGVGNNWATLSCP